MRTLSIAASVAVLGLAALRCGGGTAPAGGSPLSDGGTPDGGGSDAGPALHLLAVVRSGSGSVQSAPAGVDCGATCSFLFVDGSSISLSAAPAPGWKFAGWAGACGGLARCQVNLHVDTTVYATFEPAAPAPGKHFLSVARAGGGTGRVSSSPAGIDCGTACGAPFDESVVVSLTAVADTGSKFSGWAGACTGNGGCSVSMAQDRTVTATFELLPPPDECVGLRPPDPGLAPHGAFQAIPPPPAQVVCRPGVVAGSGTLALPRDDLKDEMVAGTTILFARPSGELLGPPTGGQGPIALSEQLDGFVAQHFPPGTPSWLSVFDSAGRESGVTPPTYVSSMVEDPTGGVVVVQSSTPSSLLQSYDAQLQLRWSRALPTGAGPALRVDRAGNTLVLWNGLFGSGTIGAFWVDHRGGGADTAFELVKPGEPRDLVATERVGGGLFLASGGVWRWQLDTLSTVRVPAPAWLAGGDGFPPRLVREMHMVHGGRGYAILPKNPGEAGPCAQEIEVVAPSGKSCGVNVFRAAAGACRPLAIRVGYDGTVVQQVPSTGEKACSDDAAQCSCMWHWWPGFYR